MRWVNVPWMLWSCCDHIQMAEQDNLSVAQLRVFFLLILVRACPQFRCAIWTTTVTIVELCKGIVVMESVLDSHVHQTPQSVLSIPLVRERKSIAICMSGECKTHLENCTSSDSSNTDLAIVMTIVGALLFVPIVVVEVMAFCLMCTSRPLHDTVEQRDRVLIVNHDLVQPYQPGPKESFNFTVIYLPSPDYSQPTQSDHSYTSLSIFPEEQPWSGR